MEMLEWVLVGVCAIDFVLHLLAIAVIKYEKDFEDEEDDEDAEIH